MLRVPGKWAGGRLIVSTSAVIPTSSKSEAESGSDVDKGGYLTLCASLLELRL